jgi:hypothetical protein
MLGQVYVRENKNALVMPNGQHIATATVLAGINPPIEIGDQIFALDGEVFSDVKAMRAHQNGHPTSTRVSFLSAKEGLKPQVATYGAQPLVITKDLLKGMAAAAGLTVLIIGAITEGMVSDPTPGMTKAEAEAARRNADAYYSRVMDAQRRAETPTP